jgi:hypothetical protein
MFFGILTASSSTSYHEGAGCVEATRSKFTEAKLVAELLRNNQPIDFFYYSGILVYCQQSS